MAIGEKVNNHCLSFTCRFCRQKYESEKYVVRYLFNELASQQLLLGVNGNDAVDWAILDTHALES